MTTALWQVAPYTGAWIEIAPECAHGRLGAVAPYTGAWIEMFAVQYSSETSVVAPYTGAWIEICLIILQIVRNGGRSLHGSVD